MKEGKKRHASFKANDVSAGIVYGTTPISTTQYENIEKAGNITLSDENKENLEWIISRFIALHDSFDNQDANAIDKFPTHIALLKYLEQLKQHSDELINFTMAQDGITSAARRAMEQSLGGDYDIEESLSSFLIGLGRAINTTVENQKARVDKLKGGHPANDPFRILLCDLAVIYRAALGEKRLVQKELGAFVKAAILLTEHDGKVRIKYGRDYPSDAQLYKRAYEMFREIKS